MRNRFAFVGAAILAVYLTVVLGGCGGGDKSVATQVAAKVNGDEISVHQVNFAMSRIGSPSQSEAGTASQQILEKLVEQRILVQKAKEKKLDRDPNVMQAIEASKQQILAQAYLEQIASTASKGSSDEIRAFYAKHPELFEKRRIFRFNELVVRATAEQVAALREAVSKAKTLDDVAAWLKTQSIKFAANVTTKGAEQLPMELVPTFTQMKPGNIAVIPQAGYVMVSQLVTSQEAPLDEKQATPIIERFLNRQRQMDLVGTRIKDLRAEAKVEYMGSFAKAKSADKSVDTKKISNVEPDLSPAKVKPDEKGLSNETITKGLSGLK